MTTPVPDDDYLRDCPSCGTVNTGQPYDIGDGPEFGCTHCEWCWGARGQRLTSTTEELDIGADYDPVWSSW